MAVEVTPLGFRKPDGNEPLRTADNDISHNAQKAQDYLGQLIPDVDALKTVAGLQPGDVSDATVSLLVSDPASQTRVALGGVYATTDSPAFTGTPTGLTKAHVGLANVDNTTDAAKPVSLLQRGALDAEAKTRSNLFGQGSTAVVSPALVGLKSILTDTGNVLVDGAKFFTLLDVRGRITAPLDNYYGYVAGHDSTAIWLVTGPTPSGPWTYRQAVRTLANSPLVGQDHVSSPEAVWFKGKVHLYYHGQRPTAQGTGQPTVVATSTNGVTFTEQPALAIPTAYETDRTRYYALSTSYARIVNAGGYLAAVFQANNALTNGQNNAVTTSVGFATSTDGISWQVSPAPLIAHKAGESGPFSPGIARVGSMWWVFTYVPARNSVELYVSDKLLPGSFHLAGSWFTPPAGFDWVDSPKLAWFDGIPNLYFGATDSTGVKKGEIYHATLDWTANQ